MASILIRDVSKETIEKLKMVAREHNRSLQQELKEAIENLASSSTIDIARKADAIRKRLIKKNISFSDSAELLREDRCR
ncbi:MAG: hypothetical protein K8I29_18555 [Alphaproteobacteria bacterium]|uniref:Antitoxin FitA-like ribbon-helix-helix domain-containing protein n=1 Tax=Candidatus Nitrobium versatile TaxID=2884831 RepID=A0A953SEZ3_9BACT|nr:hypothetical protein [Candidatus Nitrobium versatile]